MEGTHRMSAPRILLVEDDPTSRVFIESALGAVPAQVESCDSVASALQLARSVHFDLWLFDARLPDGSGVELLAQLRAKGYTTPALAHTASDDPAVHAELLAAGFRQVMVKPLSILQVQAVARQMLEAATYDDGNDEAATPHSLRRGTSVQDPTTVWGDTPVWDDEAALQALNGNPAHVADLRRMFLADLPRARHAIGDGWRQGNPGQVREGLHKLRAGCGFVGAARLADAVDALALRPESADCHERFDRAVRDTLDAADQSSLPGFR
jgi:DNA-binding response OmpR family regulator